MSIAETFDPAFSRKFREYKHVYKRTCLSCTVGKNVQIATKQYSYYSSKYNILTYSNYSSKYNIMT